MAIKISELTPKGANLEATDLLEISEVTADGYDSKSITGAEIITAAQSGLQVALVSGTNIKTINSTSLLGSGDVDVQPTLVSGTNIKTINGNTLLGTGDLVVGGGGGLTIGTTAITSGTVGGVLFEGTGNVLQESANLFWDNTNGRLGVGTSLPNMALDIRTGNVGIGVTSDAGFKLDVNGTARVSGQITTTTANAQFGTIGASTGNFRIDGVNGGGYAFAVYSSNTLRFGVVGFGGISMPSGFTIVSGSTDLTTTRLRIGTGNSTAVINIQAQAGNADIVSFKASSGTDQFTIKNTSGNILVGTATDVPSSKLTIQSTTQGFLPPRMTTTQKNAIASPAVGLVVYDTTLNKLCLFTTAWETITSV